MTQLAESQRRSLAAIGDSCVIPAKAGIQASRKDVTGFPRPCPREGGGGNDGKTGFLGNDDLALPGTQRHS